MKLALTAGAVRDLRRAADHHRGIDPDLSRGFEAEVRGAISRLVELPHLWRVREGGYRHAPVRRFPYRVVYAIRGDVVVVVAVAHVRRRPGYWEE